MVESSSLSFFVEDGGDYVTSLPFQVQFSTIYCFVFIIERFVQSNVNYFLCDKFKPFLCFIELFFSIKLSNVTRCGVKSKNSFLSNE